MKNARKASEILQAAGYKAYVVGGAVRDSIMGEDPKDWDLATDATPEQVMFLFRGEHTVIPTGITYGTVTVMMPDYVDVENREHVMEPLEITTFRCDQSYRDGRRPDAVTFSQTIEEDLARRDFTVNAIAWDVISGEYVDPYNGRKDIADSVLRCVGYPTERFCEDGLRIMRAIRFACTKGLTIDSATEVAIGSCKHMVDCVSKERIRDEFLKILGSPLAPWGMWYMGTYGLLSRICPELDEQPGCLQNRYHRFDVWDHTLACLSNCESDDPIMMLAVLLHDIAKPETQNPHPKRPGEFQFLEHEVVGAIAASQWMTEYKFSNDDVKRVSHIIQHHLILYDPKWSDAAVRRWVRRVGQDSIADLMCMARCDLLGKGLDVTEPLNQLHHLAWRILMMQEPIVTKSSELAINGHDVMKLMELDKGCAAVGEMMRYLMECVTDDPSCNTRELLIDAVVCKIARDNP